jgi:hypothetical protein
MNPNNERRCPHYQFNSEPLEMEGASAYLAVRRCLLTERQVKLLRKTPEGHLLADKLVVHINPEKTYAFVGPDLEAVTQQTCTVKRCEERCTPAYVQGLEHFGIEDPNIESVTCQEDGLETHELEETEVSSPCSQT